MLGNILSLSLQLVVSFFFTFSLLLPLCLRFFPSFLFGSLAFEIPFLFYFHSFSLIFNGLRSHLTFGPVKRHDVVVMSI